jgi:hypothetical protein
MCADGDRQQGIRAWWRNAMAGDYPPNERWRLLVTNLARRTTHGFTCCGHPGEPGC